MKTLTFTNEKGGVGKTTEAVHVAAEFARRGYRVLLIDTDPQGNATEMLGLKRQRNSETGEIVSPGIYRLLVGEAQWKYVMRTPDRRIWAEDDTQGTLLVLDSGIEARTIGQNISSVKLLQERLLELEGHIDLVVIDTSPTPNLFHSVIYVASDFIVYPSQCELPSMTGLAKSASHMRGMQEARVHFGLPATKVLGILPTMYESNTLAHQHGLAMIHKQFGDLTMSPIKKRTVWRDASFAKKLVFTYEPNSEAVSEIESAVDYIFEGMMANV